MVALFRSLRPLGWKTLAKANLKNALAAPLLILFVVPVIASLIFSLTAAFDSQGWAAVFHHPQISAALALSLYTGLASTVVSLILAVVIVTGCYTSRSLSSLTGAMIAVPHVALTIGISFLIMPSGFLARLLSLFTGWQTPPGWVTTHDPWGLALISILVIKETPFLVWCLATILNGEDLRNSFAGQRAAALSLGHDIGSIWLRIFLPQVLPKLLWPLMIVFVYAATVVDVAIVIGPTQPPPLSLIAWGDINDAQVNNNMRGAAAAWLLTGAVAATVLAVWGLARLILSRRTWLAAGPAQKFTLVQRAAHTAQGAKARMGAWAHFSRLVFFGLLLFYLVTTFTLVFLSVAMLWPFPHLLPDTASFGAWARVAQDAKPLFTSLFLATTTAVTALFLSVSWMETQPQPRDRFILVLSIMALGLPALLISLGSYRAFLEVGLTGTLPGLFIAHLVPVTAYMFIVLVGPYRSFDPRWKSSATGLLSGVLRFLLRVKFPLLKAPLLGACGVGFAVSFGQYIPAQLIAGGRFSTLPMEAVTLTSGANRPLTAAFALLLMLPPLFLFVLTARLGKARWSRT